MKKRMMITGLCLLLAGFGASAYAAESTGFYIASDGIRDGKIADRFGKRGEQFSAQGMPNYSLPLSFHNAPAGTKCFAIVLEDKDAVPVVGFSWIHWLATNIKQSELPENASVSATDFTQGTNSWSSKLGGLARLDALGYGGMAPPDQPHRYELHAYALDRELELQNGFYYNEMWKAMQGHVLAQYTLAGWYAN